MPDVALGDTDDMGLPDAGDAVGQLFDLEPAFRDLKPHDALQ
jgi:hypothetical protein